MDLHAVTRCVSDGLLNSLVAGTAIALLGWAIAMIARRQGSGTRFVVWLLALLAVAVLPWVGSVGAASHRTVPSLATVSLTLPESFASLFFVAWIIGAGLGLFHLAHGLYRLQRLRTTCMPIDFKQLDPALRASLTAAASQRRVTLCTSDAVRVPAAVGYFRPMVVFPAWALVEIPPTELEAILLHELAHLRRWDDWTNLAQKVLKVVFFFHPAVWFIESRLTLEREMACDDAVLAANFNARAYAESLVGLAEKSFVRRGVQLAQAAVGHVRQLKIRLAEILRKDKGQQGSTRLRQPAIVLMSLAGVVLVYGAAHAPRLIAFSSVGPQMVSASAPSRVLSPANDVRFQPVNLNYADRPQPSIVPVCKVQRAHLRVTHRVATTPGVLLARRTRENEMADEVVPPRILLSNFPIDLNSSPAAVLVVFQGEQFGPNGPIFWKVTILHVTPAQQRAITGGIQKQI
jgi:beta-lactamase regulating signal transducer with metallopeptidase domain